uniref:Uncharacterized protein n=1 Tax=Rhizophora mucronata TaxID=61149 RepID=A0A2P2R4Q8_RHIMU
MSCISCKSFS